MSDALREMESQVGVLSKAVVKAKAEYDNKVHAIEEEKQAQAAPQAEGGVKGDAKGRGRKGKEKGD